MFDFYCLYLCVYPFVYFLRNVAKISSCTNVYTLSTPFCLFIVFSF